MVVALPARQLRASHDRRGDRRARLRADDGQATAIEAACAHDALRWGLVMLVALVDGVAALAERTGQRGNCPGCGSEVVSKCGNVLAHHWSHKGDNCGHESDVHLALKLLFAYPNGACEVSPKGISRRADVLMGRTVYEIQHSPIDDKAVRAREDDWAAGGYEVVWVVDDDAGITVASSNVVRVRLLPDYRLTMWCKGVEPETFDPMRLGRTASAMATDMLLRSAREAAWAAKVRAEQAKAEEEQANERRRQAHEDTKRAQREAAEATQAAAANRAEIERAKSDRIEADWSLRQAKRLKQDAQKLAESASVRNHAEHLRTSIQWIQQRTGVRNIGMLRRIAAGDDAAAAVIAAIDTRDKAAVRAAIGKATAEQAARRVSDTCMVWAGVGSDGRLHCCRIWSGEREIFNNVAEALLWCVEGLPAPVGQEN